MSCSLGSRGGLSMMSTSAYYVNILRKQKREEDEGDQSSTTHMEQLDLLRGCQLVTKGAAGGLRARAHNKMIPQRSDLDDASHPAG
jgi:hypothetical protein